MAIEIERKFLVADDGWQAHADRGTRIRQAYLASSEKNSVRIRINNNRRARLTIKSGYRGLSRDEFEYSIPIDEARKLIELRQSGMIEKTRYNVVIDGMRWEVDVFAGANKGLVVAEIELTDEDQLVKLPDWLGEEVSGDLRFQNSSLAANPFSKWETSAE